MTARNAKSDNRDRARDQHLGGCLVTRSWRANGDDLPYGDRDGMAGLGNMKAKERGQDIRLRWSPAPTASLERQSPGGLLGSLRVSKSITQSFFPGC